MTMSDWLIILATVSGPILAVQAQKWVERATESRNQKLFIFATLMNTRATRLANEHVRALNMIEMVFRAKAVLGAKKEKAVIDSWRLYADKLNENHETQEALRVWNQQCEDRFIELLYALSQALGFKFDKVALRRGIYYPRGLGEADETHRLIQHNLAKVLAGEQSILMNVVGFPVSKEAMDLQQKVQEAILKSLSSVDGAIRVSVQTRENKT